MRQDEQAHTRASRPPPTRFPSLVAPLQHHPRPSLYDTAPHPPLPTAPPQPFAYLVLTHAEGLLMCCVAASYTAFRPAPPLAHSQARSPSILPSLLRDNTAEATKWGKERFENEKKRSRVVWSAPLVYAAAVAAAVSPLPPPTSTLVGMSACVSVRARIAKERGGQVCPPTRAVARHRYTLLSGFS